MPPPLPVGLDLKYTCLHRRAPESTNAAVSLQVLQYASVLTWGASLLTCPGCWQVQSVRENALHLLRLLAERVWQDGATPQTSAQQGALMSPGSGTWGLLHQPSNGSLLADAAGGCYPAHLVATSVLVRLCAQCANDAVLWRKLVTGSACCPRRHARRQCRSTGCPGGSAAGILPQLSAGAQHFSCEVCHCNSHGAFTCDARGGRCVSPVV